MSRQLKHIHKFANEAEEQAFWEKHDSTDYLDWTNAQRVVLPIELYIIRDMHHYCSRHSLSLS